MKRKRALALALAVLTLLALITGCAASPKTSDNNGFVIGLSSYSLTNSWRVQLEAEFVQRADELKADGVISEYYITNANDDLTKQISDIRDLMTKGCNAILVDALSADGLNDVCEEAMENGIVVISFDDVITSDKITAKVHSDNYEFGRQCGEFLGNALKDVDNAKVIVLDGTAGTTTDTERHNGGVDAMLAINPSIEIIATLNCEWDYATAKAAMESALTAYPQIDGVLSQGGAMTQAAMEAFQAAGRDMVPMTGEANNGFLRCWIDALDEGFSSVAPSSPTYQSATALDTAISALQGKPFEKDDIIIVDPITDDTVKDFYRSDLSDSYWCYSNLTESKLQELFKK